MAKKKPVKKKTALPKRAKRAQKSKPFSYKAAAVKPDAEREESVVSGETPQPVRGMRDILPKEEEFWRLIKNTAEQLSERFGYGYLETPLLEHRSLFVRGVGGTTDVVQKEMYCFKDQGGDEVCLRPEGTAAAARAYINHGMLNQPQPVKLWYAGPFFRRERPQAGRHREFHQWGLEVIGDNHAVLDAEVISIAMAFFDDLKISVRLEMNSIGCQECRGRYLEALMAFYQPKKELLCANCKVRIDTNRLRLLDCKEAQCELLREGAPHSTDMLCEPCRDHFMKVLEYLDEAAVTYELNPYLVRGLDYYNRTVFEIFAADEKAGAQEETKAGQAAKFADAAQRDNVEEEPKKIALGAGGRYDGLVEQLGGRPAPAVGFSIGLERVLHVLKISLQREGLPVVPKVFIAQLGDGARKKALLLWHSLRRKFPVMAVLSKDGLKSQLETANREGVRYTIIIGQKEILDHTAIIRDMEAGIQEVVDYNKVVSAMEKKLE